MGKTNQERLRRKVAQAYKNCQRVYDDLGELAELFDKDHPDMAELLKVICVSQEICQGMLETFCMKAWGRVPETFESWRNPHQRADKVTDGPTE